MEESGVRQCPVSWLPWIRNIKDLDAHMPHKPARKKNHGIVSVGKFLSLLEKSWPVLRYFLSPCSRPVTWL